MMRSGYLGRCKICIDATPAYDDASHAKMSNPHVRASTVASTITAPSVKASPTPFVSFTKHHLPQMGHVQNHLVIICPATWPSKPSLQSVPLTNGATRSEVHTMPYNANTHASMTEHFQSNRSSMTCPQCFHLPDWPESFIQRGTAQDRSDMTIARIVGCDGLCDTTWAVQSLAHKARVTPILVTEFFETLPPPGFPCLVQMPGLHPFVIITRPCNLTFGWVCPSPRSKLRPPEFSHELSDTTLPSATQNAWLPLYMYRIKCPPQTGIGSGGCTEIQVAKMSRSLTKNLDLLRWRRANRL